MVATFYSLQDTKTPVKVAVISLVVNIALSIVLMGPMQHGGLALAISLSSGVNLVLLIWVLRKRLGRIGARDILHSVLKCSASAAIMGGAISFAAMWAMPKSGLSPWHLFVWVMGSVVAGCVIYAGCARLFKCQELGALIDIVKATTHKKHV